MTGQDSEIKKEAKDKVECENSIVNTIESSNKTDD